MNAPIAQSGAASPVLAQARHIFAPRQVVEVRVPKAGQYGTISGFFDNGKDLAAACEELSGRFPGVYVTLNPLKPELLERSRNRLTYNADKGTLANDNDVACRRWLLVDADPVRKSDVSSTEAEKALAMDAARTVRAWLAARGWPEPIMADSGNGAHLLYRIDLPNDDGSKAMVHGVLKRLAAEFDTDCVKIDTKVANASRICKAYGTLSAKGEPTEERPHRMSALVMTPAALVAVTAEQLQDVQPVQREKPRNEAMPAMPPAPGANRYALAALESAAARIAGAGQGSRNDTLNTEAFGVFQLVAGGALGKATAWNVIEDAAERCGLDLNEINSTMHSAWDGAQKFPRVPPEPDQRKARQAPALASRLPANVDPETGEIRDQAVNDNATATGRDMATVDWWSPFPDANGKGKPISTIENVAEACRRLGVIVRYNVIKKDLEILIPGEVFSVDNRANASLAWVASACNRFGVPGGQLGDFLAYLGDKNLYNPVANWVTSRPWDGTSRLQAFYNTIRAEGEEDDYRVWDLKAAMIRRWMISAVAAAFNPNGVSAHGVLVLQGDQYLGKTKWFKSLVPSEMGVIADGLMLRTDDKDSVKTVVSNWLVELGELDATFRKSDIAALKAFLTKDRDILRRPYAKLESEYARRTVFFASVNPRQFLHDPTGNRRYWTISATEINHSHGLNMQQVWAEVYEQHYLKGETWYLAPEEMAALNDHNRDHEVLDPIRERLLTRLDWRSESRVDEWRWMTATDIMLEIGFDRPTRADVTHCGQLVQELNGGRRKKSNGKALSYVPPRVSSSQ